MTMRHKYIILVTMLAALLLGSTVIALSEESTQTHTIHPVEVTGVPVCSSCHTVEYSGMDHTQDFSSRHKFFAMQRQQTCNLCHKESFCADCHANKEEIKPSDKFKDSPERMLPHPGDYLTQHMVDGKIDPAPCMKCHGRRNNERCRSCHR